MFGRVRAIVPLVLAVGLWAGGTALPAAASPATASTAKAPALPDAKAAAQDAETLWKQGLEAVEAGALDKAVGLFNQSLAVDPHGRAVMVDLASTLTDLGRLDDARQTYERAVKLYPNDAVALNGLGYVHYRQEHFDQAIAYYRRAIAHMDDPQFHINMGLAFLGQDRFGLAEDEFRRTLELSPGHYWATNNLGYALQLQGRTEEAVDAYYEALPLDGKSVTTHLNLGQVRLDGGEWEEAADIYADALKRNDQVGEAHVGLALALTRMGRHQEARREAKLGVMLEKDSGPAFHIYGEALARTGDWAAAIEAEKSAIRYAPDNARYKLTLARMLEWKERYDEAITAYKAFLAQDPDHAEAADARMCLRLLQER